MKKPKQLMCVVNIKNTVAETALTLPWPNANHSVKTCNKITKLKLQNEWGTILTTDGPKTGQFVKPIINMRPTFTFSIHVLSFCVL